MDPIRFARPEDAPALRVYLERLLALDKAAAVRFVGVGHAAAAYAAPPLHGSASRGVTVLTMRAVGLGGDPPPFDRTVAAGRLLDAIAGHDDGAGDGVGAVTLPEPLLGGPSWAGLLPPRRGWRPLGRIPVRDLAEAVAQGNADFRFAALGRDRAALDTLAEEIWTRELPHGVRRRAAHALSVMGFLGPDPQQSTYSAAVAANGRWLRVDTPYGSALERVVAEQEAAKL
jgi:hypothetical protein